MEITLALSLFAAILVVIYLWAENVMLNRLLSEQRKVADDAIKQSFDVLALNQRILNVQARR